jgi:glycosyltransferase involved in cell wall biosynthesis
VLQQIQSNVDNTETARAGLQMNRIGVLFIIDQLCEMGGAERVLVRMVDHLPRERYAPRVLTFKIDDSLGFSELLACPLHVQPLRRTYDWQAVKTGGYIRRLVRQNNIKITHTFHETSDLWAGPIAKASGCPILISSRRDMGYNRRSLHRRAYRWLGRCFDQVQTVSEQVRRRNIEADGLDPDRVVTVYNGVDAPTLGPVDKFELRKRLGFGDAAHLIVSVGHIRTIKGVDIFVRAAARVREQISGAVFVVAGEDHEPAHTRYIRQLIREFGLDGQFFLKSGITDVTSLLRASDVFCLLSRSEGLSNALLEAMACAMPSVATAVGGNPELVSDGVTGFLVANEDDASAADRIVRLLRNPQTADSIGAQARARMEQGFTTEMMMRRLMESYETLLRDRLATA